MTTIARRAATLLAVLVWPVAGCVTEQQRGLPTFAGADGPIGTVTAVRQDITSVVALDATVTASPAYSVTAPIAGTISFTGSEIGLVATIMRDGAVAEIVLPVNASTERRLVGQGATVPAGLPVIEARYTGFALSASVPVATLYRFYGPLGPVRGQIERGPGPFDCPLLGSLTATGDAAEPSVLSCAPPGELRLLAGSRAIIAVTTGNATGVLTLPVEAVAGLAERGVVTVQRNGRTESRTVGLGITDGSLVEITHGLAEDEMVLIPAPDLRKS